MHLSPFCCSIWSHSQVLVRSSCGPMRRSGEIAHQRAAHIARNRESEGDHNSVGALGSGENSQEGRIPFAMRSLQRDRRLPLASLALECPSIPAAPSTTTHLIWCRPALSPYILHAAGFHWPIRAAVAETRLSIQSSPLGTRSRYFARSMEHLFEVSLQCKSQIVCGNGQCPFKICLHFQEGIL